MASRGCAPARAARGRRASPAERVATAGSRTTPPPLDPTQRPAVPASMALTIYGTPRSRTMRVLWTAAELGLDYERVSLTVDDPWLKSPAFLAINPAGAIPAIVDEGFALAESMAINL